MNLTPKQIQALRIAVAEVAGVEGRLEGYNCVSPDGKSICMSTDTYEECQAWLDSLRDTSPYKQYKPQPWYSWPNYPESLDEVQSVILA